MSLMDESLKIAVHARQDPGPFCRGLTRRPAGVEPRNTKNGAKSMVLQEGTRENFDPNTPCWNRPDMLPVLTSVRTKRRVPWSP